MWQDLDIQARDAFDRFLKILQVGTKEEMDTFLFCLFTDENETKYSGSQIDPSEKLRNALDDNNLVEAWKLIVETNEREVSETLENFTAQDCKIITKNGSSREDGCHLKCNWDFQKLCETLRSSICWIFNCDEGDLEEEAEMRSEKERIWIDILSNPLYISLEWLWRNNPNSQYKKGARRKESKSIDIIEAALDDAYLLEKIASYERHYKYYSRDDYKQRAMEYEKFAIDVVEQVHTSELNQLHEIMDIKGNGSLLKKKPENFHQSLGLLRIAADKQRRAFVASPKCQFVLNEIIYRGWRNWRDHGIVKKTLWLVLHFFLVALTCPVYIPVRLTRRGCCCGKFQDNCCWKFRKLYELPYSKFVNHTTSYVLFLTLLFASSFQHKIGTTQIGLVWIDYPVLAFVVGLFLQEALKARRQGFFNYISKWWNVVDTLIVFTFLLAYTVWLSAWGYYREWKPRKSAFIVSDSIYASATVMAFFHLAHVFQVSSVLGPLQLSLYKMLKAVLKFLSIFLLLYIAFATGVAKIYTYYVASQSKLRELDESHGYKASHPYGKHSATFMAMFWMLLGAVEDDKISVEDPAFSLTATFGRIFMIAHVVCTVIVALNMLIAMMNNSFEKIMENSDVEWKFSRTQKWLEWIDQGDTVPVPFNIVYHFVRCFYPNCCRAFCCKERRNGPEQSNLQAQVGEVQDSVRVQVFPCCCTWFCSAGIRRCTMECTNSLAEKKSIIREKRVQEMRTLVVRYLEDKKNGYLTKWKELTAQ